MISINVDEGRGKNNTATKANMGRYITRAKRGQYFECVVRFGLEIELEMKQED